MTVIGDPGPQNRLEPIGARSSRGIELVEVAVLGRVQPVGKSIVLARERTAVDAQAKGEVLADSQAPSPPAPRPHACADSGFKRMGRPSDRREFPTMLPANDRFHVREVDSIEAWRASLAPPGPANRSRIGSLAPLAFAVAIP